MGGGQRIWWQAGYSHRTRAQRILLGGAIPCAWLVVATLAWAGEKNATENTAAENRPAAKPAAARAKLAADAPLAPGFRRLEGQHLTLITDLPADPEVDELPAVFDAAFVLWCDYFGLDPAKLADWHVTGYLMQSRERFQQAGYWRADLPPFTNGFSTGDEFWCFTQTSPYYRRHLLLHEGVHSFMNELIGTSSPPWYSEGMAELLATHRWQDGKLTVRYFPQNMRELPGLGRIKLVQDAYKAGHPLGLTDVLGFDGSAHLRVAPYGWSWALAALLDGHPRYQQRFRQAADLLKQKNFDGPFRKLFAADWADLNDEWRVLVANLDYGYDFARMAIDFRPGTALAGKSRQVSIAADRGWQSSGVRLEAGQSYHITATGRYHLAAEPAPWWCEPGGVTIHYHRGRPLGQLLGALRVEPAAAAATGDPAVSNPPVSNPADSNSWSSGLVRPFAIGLDCQFVPTESGTLYLRINESAGQLADNAGQLSVEISPGAAEGK